MKNGTPAGGALSGTYPNPTLATKPVVAVASSEETTQLTATCKHAIDGEVTIDTPSSGTVTVTANVQAILGHIHGTQTSITAEIDETPTKCDAPFYTRGDAGAFGSANLTATFIPN